MAQISKVTHKLSVMPMPDEPGFVVPVSFWNAIMDRLEQCEDRSAKYEARGWAALGAGISAILTALSVFAGTAFHFVDDSGREQINWWTLSIFGVSLIDGVAAIIYSWTTLDYARQHKKDRADLRKIVLEDMQMFQNKHAVHESATQS